MFSGSSLIKKKEKKTSIISPEICILIWFLQGKLWAKTTPPNPPPAQQQSSTREGRSRKDLLEEQFWLMSFLKVDQTLMQRRGNWSKGIPNYQMGGVGGSLSERLLFLSSFILPDHMADLYITKELPGWAPLHLKLHPNTHLWGSKFWS